ncbi:hypothetical protein ACH5RR_009280 [Cinchona calisaya]|uniref:AB hydrolase-1 domain-containing protein n=1 Tax=Cinchona calisaya TaxID=153742 RepID=A0ABD3AFN8_9GENT
MAIYNIFIMNLAILLLVYSRPITAAHFVLVHGSGHGAWCWYKLATLLEQAGQNVTAIDLAYSGRNEIPLITVRTIDGYHKPLFTYLECLSPQDKVILVGHSYGGYAISSAMERFPAKLTGAVFVSAFMVGPNLTFNQLGASFNPGASFLNDSKYVGDPPRIVLFGPNYLATKLYQNSPPQDLKLANYSVRTTQFFYGELTNRQLLVTNERYGSVRRAYVIGGMDMAIPPDSQRLFIASNPPEIVREIPGSDHMVMLSTPQEFSANLLEIAQVFTGSR